ncbi:Vacuolar protein [Coemansia sp. RSA 1813]|nr:Vacuolar protein sorting-associated protein 16 [Coemansia sp. RSA 1646]KAJ1774132.1 Vacuolar protein [Coemansia sp. RSA 1843]KAJ2210786.1 Vacuolar protein [Coemansia sp. RSA 487]KAJ2563703.1 Vacuolar protein [Coemansia sp. RSA 1813]
MAHPASQWHPIHDTFYRLHRIYQMQWAGLDLTRFRVAAAPFGGPIALVRDDRQLLEAGAAPMLDPAISVFAASGATIGRIEYDGLVRVAAFSWNSREELVCVQEDGNVRVFSLGGQEPVSFSLGAEAREAGVVDCKFWDQGFVAMTGAHRFVYVNDIYEPKPRVLADAQLTELPHSWAVVAPHLTLSHHVEVLVATGRTVVSIDAVGSQDQLLDQGPYTRISVSPNGRLVALCSMVSDISSRVQVVSMDFQRSYSEYERTPPENPSDVAWCGSDAVVASFASEAVLIGPFGDTLAFAHDDAPVHLVQELDGVRMFNGGVHEFLCKVGEDARSVFQIGSTSAAALLFDALDSIRAHSPRADEIVRSIRDEMPQAVDACVAAAGAEPLIEYQQALLRAASVGRSFLAVYNGDRIADMCRHLRVINCLASYAVGIPATLMQFQSLPLETWISRLLHRNMHALALRLCQYLEAPADPVYVHWACAKIRASALDDDALFNVLKSRLDALSPGGLAPPPVASYADIAAVADRCGYKRLAARLLQLEPRAASQVPLLISMGHDAAAMDAAVRSGDTDLVYFVVFHLFKALPLAEFFHAIGRSPIAGRLFEKYCIEIGAPVLEDYYFQDDAFAKAARLIVIDSLAEPDLTRRAARLAPAAKMLAREQGARSGSTQVESRALDMYIRLLHTQRQLDSDMPGESFAGLPLNATIARCLETGNYSRAAKLRTDFKVPDKRFYWIKLRALVQRRDWAELARLASAARKSPIGYRPFVDECVAALQYQEAARYIPRCDPRDHAELYLRIGFFREAAQAAANARDADALRQIHGSVNDPALRADIARQLEQLTNGSN